MRLTPATAARVAAAACAVPALALGGLDASALEAGGTQRVSVSPGEGQGDGGAHGPAPLSHDSRLVAFASSASDLAPADADGAGAAASDARGATRSGPSCSYDASQRSVRLTSRQVDRDGVTL